MDTTDKVLYTLIGCVIGYIIRLLHEILRELRDVDKCVHECLDAGHDHSVKRLIKDEDGLIRYHPVLLNIALFLVIALTAWASFASAKVSNRVEETQHRLGVVSTCNQQFLSKTIVALNQRTDYTQERADANVALQKAQAVYLQTVLTIPTPPRPMLVNALEKYFDKLTEFIQISAQATQSVKANPYPTAADLSSCLEGGDTS